MYRFLRDEQPRGLLRLVRGASVQLAAWGRVKLVHNDVHIGSRCPTTSVPKYRYQCAYSEVWQRAYAIADRCGPSLARLASAELEHRVLVNSLATALYQDLSTTMAIERFCRATGEPLPRPPLPVPGMARLMAAGMLARRRTTGTTEAPPVGRGAHGGRTWWLIFSGHAPSRALLSILDLLDPHSTVAVVNNPYVPATVEAQVRARGIPCVTTRWDGRVTGGELQRVFRTIRGAVEAAGHPARSFQVTRDLMRLAYYWLYYRQWPFLQTLPFQQEDALVTGHDRNLMMAAFVLRASACGARTITLQDGVFTDTPHITRFPSEKIGVFGTAYRDIYLRAGRRHEDVVNIGKRDWDTLQPAPVDPAERRRLFGTGKRVALLCTQYNPVTDLETLDVIRFCQTVVAAANHWVLRIKPHPHHNIDHILARVPGGMDAKVEGDIGGLLRAADCVLAVNSTTLIEAALSGRRTGAINIAGVDGLCPFADGEMIREVRSPQDLMGLLDRDGGGDVALFRSRYASRFNSDAARTLLHS